jgi:hypothetical protein
MMEMIVLAAQSQAVSDKGIVAHAFERVWRGADYSASAGHARDLRREAVADATHMSDTGCSSNSASEVSNA